MLQLFLTFLRLGLSSFGGPVAHIAYFYEEFVKRKQWFSDAQFQQWISLCQFLPGPASSQLGIVIGYARGGYLGAFLAWLAFTTPSAFFLLAFATGFMHNTIIPVGVFYSLKILAVSVVTHALLSMLRPIGTQAKVWGIILLTILICLTLPILWVQFLWIICCAILGYALFKKETAISTHSAISNPSSHMAWRLLSVFALLLIGLPIVAHYIPTPLSQIADSFYRAGALVFGGGHTVLSWLQAETQAWVGTQDFLIGYGLTQAVPGPLFTFAAFLGGLIDGSVGGVTAVLFIFLPGALLVLGVLPLWERLQYHHGVRRAVQGVNAAVIGILASTLIHPIASSSLTSISAALLALFGFLCLQWLKLSITTVVLLFVVIGCIL